MSQTVSHYSLLLGEGNQINAGEIEQTWVESITTK